MIKARVSNDFAAQVDFNRLGAVAFELLAKIDVDDVARLVLGPETCRLLAHVVDEFRTLNAFGEAGEILDQSGKRQLSAGLVAFDNQRAQVGASRIEGSGESGASGTDDNHVANVVCHGTRCRFGRFRNDAWQ